MEITLKCKNIFEVGDILLYNDNMSSEYPEDITICMIIKDITENDDNISPIKIVSLEDFTIIDEYSNLNEIAKTGGYSLLEKSENLVLSSK